MFVGREACTPQAARAAASRATGRLMGVLGPELAPRHSPHPASLHTIGEERRRSDSHRRTGGAPTHGPPPGLRNIMGASRSVDKSGPACKQCGHELLGGAVLAAAAAGCRPGWDPPSGFLGRHRPVKPICMLAASSTTAQHTARSLSQRAAVATPTRLRSPLGLPPPPPPLHPSARALPPASNRPQLAVASATSTTRQAVNSGRVRERARGARVWRRDDESNAQLGL